MPFNALDFLINYNIQYWEEGKNCQDGWINICCPICGDDSNHGGFNLIKSYYCCWRCGWHPLKEIISNLIGIPESSAKQIINEFSSNAYIRKKLNNKKNNIKINKIELPGEKLQEMHKKYLRKRNFDPDYIEDKYKIKGTGLVGEWKFRIIIPIYQNNILVTFQGRRIKNKQKIRYKDLSIDKSILDPKKCLYNIDNCKNDFAIVVEGVFDVWRMGDNFLSTFGTSISPQQLRLLRNKFKKVIFLFDPESEAEKKANKFAVNIASFGKDIEIITDYADCDPADLNQKDADELKRSILNEL